MLTKSFWLGEGGVLVRAIRTWAQTAVAAIGVGTTNLFSADIKNVLALASSAAILSILMSLDRTSGTQPHDANLEIARPNFTPTAEPLQAGYTGS